MKLEEHLVLELKAKFELLVPKGGFSWALKPHVAHQRA